MKRLVFALSHVALVEKFLIAVIIYLTVGAEIGIFRILFGELNGSGFRLAYWDLLKLLAIALIFGFYNLTALFTTLYVEIRFFRLARLAFLGMILSLTGFSFIVLLIWLNT